MANGVTSIIPTSPVALAFGSLGPEEKMTGGGAGGGEGGGDKEADKTSGGGGSSAEGKKSKIQPKEFFWDQFLIYIATIVALLTVLDVTLQFFRGGGLVCRVPGSIVGEDNRTIELTRDEVTFVNTFCQQSLSLAEYYPLFVLIQGLVLAAPQYLWAALFGGQFDFFFGLVQQLDRLRSNETGEYRSQNFDIVNKLEKQFPRKWKWVSIFSFYIAKLLLQLLVVILSILMNAALFQEHYFDFSFDCPDKFNSTSPPKGWWLSFQVTCVFSSFRLHLRLQNVNYLLLVLALGAIVYGLIWCAKRHVNALGYQEAALFAFSSCLRPEEYVHEKIWNSPLNPRICNDLDFLLMRLFRADSGHGYVFKDIQVEREIKWKEEKDHELLHLYVEATKSNYPRPDQYGNMQPSGRDVDLRKSFKDAGFSTDPEENVFDMLGEQALGNITWESIKISSIRNVIFGFLQFVTENDLALDISFGTSGYSLILARAFKDVISFNFHPFYSNDEEVYHLEQFHADYCTFRFQENILTKGTTKFTKLEEAISEEFEGPYPESPELNKKANFLLVGPFTDEAKIATVNLFLEGQNNASRYAEGCILMYIRPLEIGPRTVENRFCQYTPPSGLFRAAKNSPRLNIQQKLERYKATANKANNIQVVVVDSDRSQIQIECSQTTCIFEFTVFEFAGEVERRPNLSPGSRPPQPGGNRGEEGVASQAGNIALISPSQMLPQLDRDKIQKFLDGNMAIQLQARSPENPIQFILPAGMNDAPDNELPDCGQRPANIVTTTSVGLDTNFRKIYISNIC